MSDVSDTCGVAGSNETKAEAEELHSGPPAGHAELFKQMSAAVNRLLAGAPHPDPSAQASHPDPTPPSPTLPLPGVEQDPCVGFASSSDGKPQPEEEEEGWLPLCSRAVAPEPKGHVPRAGSVFDEAPMPPAAAEFDEALVTVDGFLHDGNSGEEEQRQALSRQPDQAMKARAACEEAEEQGQSQLQESRHESPGTHARHDSPGSYAQHDSPAHHAQHDRLAEAGWTRAHILPQVESAPPVTPDSPNHSSASPSSPGWGFSEGGWDPSTRAMLYTHQHPAWDSPPGAAPTSPAPACAVADNSCARRSGHRAASGSPAPVALSPHDPAWHSPPPSQANTPLHGSTSPLSPSEGHPSGMDVAGGLGGVNSAQYGSYCSRYPLTPDDPRSWSRARSPGLEFEVYSPRYDSSSCHGSQRLLSPTPHSPSSPHSNPPPQAETHINRWRWWRPRTPASRAATMDAPGGFTASPHPPTHPEGPGRAATKRPALLAPDHALPVA